jgi:TolB-like protein
MPFVNASNNPDAEYLSDGISESLINSLSQLPQLKVIARSSSFKFKGKTTEPAESCSHQGKSEVLQFFPIRCQRLTVMS